MLVIFKCIKTVTNILNRSPTSQSCHQHIWSSTFVTNIDVTVIILVKRELRGSLKELKHLQKLNCGFISCYSRSVEIVEESKIFQLCSTYMDTSDDNFDLNDFLGIGINVVYIRELMPFESYATYDKHCMSFCNLDDIDPKKECQLK